ncbi:unnamed protein product [Protopolystoma xenopodis]|uniref:Uncharacterized protein n=1 Tax=Protopolystoma xenopodis TaxID=117903 RepID=A0A448WPX4_9PLAT|nr:unnamed protein product [Protopolystoma xenopodis]
MSEMFCTFCMIQRGDETKPYVQHVEIGVAFFKAAHIVSRRMNGLPERQLQSDAYSLICDDIEAAFHLYTTFGHVQSGLVHDPSTGHHGSLSTKTAVGTPFNEQT